MGEVHNAQEAGKRVVKFSGREEALAVLVARGGFARTDLERLFAAKERGEPLTGDLQSIHRRMQAVLDAIWKERAAEETAAEVFAVDTPSQERPGGLTPPAAPERTVDTVMMGSDETDPKLPQLPDAVEGRSFYDARNTGNHTKQPLLSTSDSATAILNEFILRKRRSTH